MENATTLARRHYSARQAHDEDAMRQILDAEVTLRGPLGTVTTLEVHARVATEHDAITWFDPRETLGGRP